MLFDEAGGRRRGWRIAVAAAAAALFCALAAPGMVRAAELTVNSTGDQADSTLGVGCLTAEEIDAGEAEEECTLRAALETSNASEGVFDTLAFDEVVFDGQAPATIVLGSSLPTVADAGLVNGRQCPTEAGETGPCVGVEGPGSGPALIVEETEGFELAGLAFTGASVGIEVSASPRFKAQASWFGVKLDGSPGANTTGILLRPGSANGRIGGEGPETRNVFANSAANGLEIHGAAGARVLGNYFGIEPDGSTPALNGGDDIEVASTGGSEAVGTAIGTKIRLEGVTTAQCDFGCNVISGAGDHGVDLVGDGGSEAPTAATTIAGNYIGLNSTGSAAVANTSTGVRVGKAAQTVIGGPKAGEANRINGGGVAVLAGPGAVDLVVRGNRIGFDAAGTGSMEAPGEGIVVNSTGLTNVALEATIAGNAIAMESGVAISQQGFGAAISGNVISSADTGIRVFASNAKHGNLIEGNVIEAVEYSGILIENDLNDVFANEISSAGGQRDLGQRLAAVGRERKPRRRRCGRGRERNRRQWRQRDRDPQPRKNRQRGGQESRLWQRRPLPRSGCGFSGNRTERPEPRDQTAADLECGRSECRGRRRPGGCHRAGLPQAGHPGGGARGIPRRRHGRRRRQLESHLRQRDSRRDGRCRHADQRSGRHLGVGHGDDERCRGRRRRLRVHRWVGMHRRVERP